MLKKLIPAAFYLLVAVFAVVYLTRLDWSTISTLKLDPLWLLIATLLSLALRLWYAEIWMLLLRRLGADLAGNRLELMVVYSKAWLGRYVPGGATWILGKIYFASKLGVSKTKLAISSFLEGALQIIGVIVCAIAVLSFDSRVAQFGAAWTWAVLVGAAIGLILLMPPVFNRLVSFGYRLVKKQTLEAEHLPNFGTILLGILSFALSAFVSGLTLFFTAKTLVPELDLGQIFYVIGTSNLASALSMLAVFAPAGLGVREAVQLSTLLLIVTPVAAVAITVFDRLWSIVMDLLFWLGALAARKLGSVKK